MMKEDMAKMKDKKMRKMYFEDLEMKEYVKSGTLYSARKTWEVRSHMLDIAGNYPGQRKYEESNWRCQACDLNVKEDQEHLAMCEGYEDLRGDGDLSDEMQFVDFFTRVMDRRKKKMENSKWKINAGDNQQVQSSSVKFRYMYLLYALRAWIQH